MPCVGEMLTMLVATSPQHDLMSKVIVKADSKRLLARVNRVASTEGKGRSERGANPDPHSGNLDTERGRSNGPLG